MLPGNPRHWKTPAMRLKPTLLCLFAALPAARLVAQAPPEMRELTVRSSVSTTEMTHRMATLHGGAQVRLSGGGDPIANSAINFASPDAWLILENVSPEKVAEDFLDRFFVDAETARIDHNIRITAYGQGTVVIPHGPDYEPLTVFSEKSLGGKSASLRCFAKHKGSDLGDVGASVRSFRLKRGYMATLAEKADGTGISRNYVAQDHDIEVRSLPAGLDGSVDFIRVFPWRWTGKKGIAGGIWQDLGVSWFYDWNIGAQSSPDLEYVPIRQTRWWPGLDQDWRSKGSTHLLGYNEPDRPDQANMKPADAIHGWPDLLATGLRLGSPAVSDGGLGWLYDFMDRAEKSKLRVDFVAVHYYRAVADPGNGRAAASQFQGFLKEIHDRTKRPIWITEWNNGANWTSGRDPEPKEQERAIREMIKMLEKTPYVERYALYNWVEDCRAVKDNAGNLTPAGIVYRDQPTSLAYRQEKY